MAFWVRLTLLLAADSHLNTRLWSIRGKAELLYSRFKGTSQSPLSSASPHTSRNSTNSRCPLGNPKALWPQLLYTTRHCILIWILSTAFFLIPNERESDDEEREGGGSMGWEVVRAKIQELFGYLQTTAGKGEIEKFMGSP